MREISRQFASILLAVGLAGASLPAQAGLYRELGHYGYGTPIYADVPVWRPRALRPLHRSRFVSLPGPLVIPGPRIVSRRGPRFGWFTPYGALYSQVFIAGARPSWVTWMLNVRNGFGYGTAYVPPEPLFELDGLYLRRP